MVWKVNSNYPQKRNSETANRVVGGGHASEEIIIIIKRQGFLISL